MNTIIIKVIIYMRIMVDEYSFAPVVMRQAQADRVGCTVRRRGIYLSISYYLYVYNGG